jgi:L-ribulose-5-phosphate 3-epimerase
MANILSYRMNYVKSPQLPLERIAALGIRYVEIVLAPDETAKDIRQALDPHGLKVSTIHAHPTPLADDTLFDTIRDASDKAQQLGALGLFVSVHAGDMPVEQAADRLRQAGDIAAEYGVFIAMETHPDLCENGDKAAATLSLVDHPAVGWNIDTANIYYYNRDVGVVDEVRKAARYVRAVHAKDTTGGFEDPTFPNLGEGIVDYAAVAAVLAEAGFSGPWTMELEGVAGSADSVEQMEANVRACADHLRTLGVAE